MNFNEYQAEAMRTAKVEEESQTSNLVHASPGLTTEVGEFVSEVKRMARYGKTLSPEMQAHMEEELGDILWYCALGAEALGVSLHSLAKANIAKLQKRFPASYSNEQAEARADKCGLGHQES